MNARLARCDDGGPHDGHHWRVGGTWWRCRGVRASRLAGYDRVLPCGTPSSRRRHAARGEVCDVCDGVVTVAHAA
jgi:hypothetical protein